MDARSEVTNRILTAMAGIIPAAAMDQLETAVLQSLEDYEIQERSTEIVVRDGTAEGLLRKYLATKRIEGKSENTIRHYERILQGFLLKLDRRLYEVGTFDLRLYLSLYKEERGVSNRTLENIRKCLSSFFSWLANEGFIPRNPCRGLKNIKYDKVMRKPFSSEELEKIKNACRTTRDLALVGFLQSTGCRVSEVVSVDAADINFKTRELVVYGKGGKERTVYLTDVAAMYLWEYLASRKDASPALFPGRGSQRIKKNAIEAIVRKIGQRAGVDTVHPHRFRRTLATSMIDRGASLLDVQRILGHEDIRTTQVYVYTSQGNVKAAFERYAA